MTDPTVADRTGERLRRMVITPELPPGTLTSESRLAQMLNCGRTPLREALQRLNHEYLVRVRPRRGVLIPELSIVEFQQTHEALLRLVIPRTPALAAARIDGLQIKGLRRVIAKALEEMGLSHSKRTYPVPPEKEIVGYELRRRES